MTENENQPTENPELELPTEEQVEAFGSVDEAVAFDVDGSDPGADVIQQLQDQLKDAEKRVLLAQADLENFRRRNRRESQDQIKYAGGGLMTDILESVDNLHRAVEAYEAVPNGDGLRDGVKMVATHIMESLSIRDC